MTRAVAARRLRTALLIGGLLSVATPAWPQATTLAPPDSHYFVSQGSWGQKYPDQWGLQRIGFDSSPQSAWHLVGGNAQPVVVAVIDTGLDWNHRNIDEKNIWRNPSPGAESSAGGNKDGYAGDLIGWNFFDNDAKPWDYDGHGTFVSGIIGASWNDKDGMAGINPFARLMVLKAINNFGHTRASYLAQAIAYAADHGARVVNLSVGGKELTGVEQAAIDYAFSKNVVIVAAAGNEGVDISSYGIAASDKVLTVAATDVDDQRAVFSNWGRVSVAAPGLDILSLRARRTDTMRDIEGVRYTDGAAYVGTDKRYYRASGTSFSAPFVSGLASLMISNDPNLTNRQVMNIIKSTARGVGTPGVNQFTGYGIIDARAALKAPKDYFLLAGISRVEVVQKGGASVVRVHGTADANALKSASIEVGQGDSPTSWKQVARVQKAAGPDSALADVPAAAFRGATVWQVRVIVTHNNGTAREARFRLNLS